MGEGARGKLPRLSYIGIAAAFEKEEEDEEGKVMGVGAIGFGMDSAKRGSVAMGRRWNWKGSHRRGAEEKAARCCGAT